MSAGEVFEIIQKLRYDATAMQAKITELQRMLSSMNLPADTPRLDCPRCGVQLAGARTLQVHLLNVHDEGGGCVTVEETIRELRLEEIGRTLEAAIEAAGEDLYALGLTADEAGVFIADSTVSAGWSELWLEDWFAC